MEGTNSTALSTDDRKKVEKPARKFSDFKIERMIGTGTFGKVYLGVLEGQPVAIKVLKKTQVLMLKQVDHVKSEKSILAEINHRFIVNLLESFQDKSNVYRGRLAFGFIIEQMRWPSGMDMIFRRWGWTLYDVYLTFEYVQGGEIFRLLRQENFFPNDVTLFYITEILLAIEYLHSKGIAYRDLKPENLLIAADGHLKITDFGFAKKIKDRSFTLCGTPEYLAPEVILSSGHNQGVDWWALGVLLFEMLAGFPPFYDNNVYEIYRKITIGFFQFPVHFSANTRVLVSGLLERDITKRLGCMSTGAADVKNQGWFRGVDWESVQRKEIPPPWVPEIEDSKDCKYYDTYPESDSLKAAPELNEMQQKLFEDF